MEEMFCFQCQETMNETACTVQGMCGKSAACANLQDALIRASQYATLYDTASDEQLMNNLFMTITNANFSTADIRRAIEKTYTGKSVEELTREGCLKNRKETVRSLQELILYGLKGLCAYLSHAAVLGFRKAELSSFVRSTLVYLLEDHEQKEYLTLLDKTGEMGVQAMALLDEANTATYGQPEITTVSLETGSRPGILVSGHDLHDLKELLEQSRSQGIDIYTHGEMLPAHSYPEFKKYEHFKGNYGNAWWRQNEEFEAFNGPILMTTNCIIPVKDSYRQRIFTTGVVGYDGLEHIEAVNGRKDFRCIIELAKHCPAPQQLETGSVTGGFAHAQVMALQDQIVEAVKNGDIRQFIVMAGCDGRHASRSYYTDFARALPKDTVILTAGCAKYRYLKLDLGMINGIPRVLDAGQCNDSYSLVLIAEALKEAFGLQDINELPILYNIAWYEQKAVIVLLALLHLGVKNIHLGPTLPAFLSPEVVQWLKESYGIKTIQEVEKDMENFGITKREPSYGDMTMAELLKLDEGMEDVLYEAGFHCLGCPSAQLESLRDACELHALNVDEVCAAIREYRHE